MRSGEVSVECLFLWEFGHGITGVFEHAWRGLGHEIAECIRYFDQTPLLEIGMLEIRDVDSGGELVDLPKIQC